MKELARFIHITSTGQKKLAFTEWQQAQKFLSKCLVIYDWENKKYELTNYFLINKNIYELIENEQQIKPFNECEETKKGYNTRIFFGG